MARYLQKISLRPYADAEIDIGPPPANVTPVRAVADYRPGYPIQVKPIPGSDQMLLITQPRAYGPTTYWR